MKAMPPVKKTRKQFAPLLRSGFWIEHPTVPMKYRRTLGHYNIQSDFNPPIDRISERLRTYPNKLPDMTSFS